MPDIRALHSGVVLPAYRFSPVNLGQTPPEALPPDTSRLSRSQAQGALMGTVAKTLAGLPEQLLGMYVKGKQVGTQLKATSALDSLLSGTATDEQKKALEGVTVTPTSVSYRGANVLSPLEAEYKQAQIAKVKEYGKTKPNPLAASYGTLAVEPELPDPTVPTGALSGGTALNAQPSALAPAAPAAPITERPGGVISGALEGPGQPVAMPNPAGGPELLMPADAAPGGALSAPKAPRGLFGGKVTRHQGFTREETDDAFYIIPDESKSGMPEVKKISKGKDQKEEEGIFFKTPEAARQAGFSPDSAKVVPGGIMVSKYKDPSSDDTDVKAIADAIENGDQPPVLTGLYKKSGPVRAELAKRGFNLATAANDWYATQRSLAALNGPQQLRVRQAVDFTYHSLDVIEELGKEWKGGGFPIFNKAKIEAAKQGLLGPEAQSLAQRMEGQINDLVSELGTVYKGGNSSTDQTLRLAAENLKADFSERTLMDSIATIRKNLQIRANSLKNVGASGTSPGNMYAPQGAPAKEEGKPATSAPAGTVTIRDPDSGKTFKIKASSLEKYLAQGAELVE